MPTLDTANVLQYRGHLRFPELLEREFLSLFFERSVGVNRASYGVGIGVFVLFGLLDVFAEPVLRAQLWFIRFGVVVPVLVGMWLCSFAPFYPRVFQLFGALGVLLIGVGLIAIQVLSDEQDFGYKFFTTGLALLIISGYTLIRLRFWYAVLMGWGIVVLYQPVAIGIEHVFATQATLLTYLTANCYLLAANGVGMLACYTNERALRLEFLQDYTIAQERAKSERLLLNILPRSVAERLKRHKIIADQFDYASILFADMVGFTELSAQLLPQAVVQLLNQVFSAFDQLAELHGAEKIKTIGDGYMVVSGLPVPRADHARVLAEMALAMQAQMGAWHDQGLANISLRIGIHSGPVVAGVIGERKFIYDLWGDAVNLASRMESHGLAGEIQVSPATYDLLKDNYQLESRGEIKIKGKGLMETYLLKGRLNA